VTGLQTHLFTAPLAAHPDHSPLSISGIEARIIGLDDNWLRVRWRVEGAGNLVLPPFAGRGRADDLWRTTCFELFLREPGAEAYAEFNLSPSERWAAYDLTGYREGMTQRPMAREPTCTMRQGSSFAIFDAALPSASLPEDPWELGFSAVIEEEGGVLSYWALAHPPGEPDFHHPACFAARLEAPGRA
jgi:hypothetical protein